VTEPARRLHPVVRLAPAKLNLTLSVVGRRPDGFHDLHSVVVPLELSDRLSLAVAPMGDDSLHVTGLDAGPLEANLVMRAVAATRAAAAPFADGGPAALPPLAARLEKRIPVAAGLGGGSSDAAAAIDAACEAWQVDLPPEDRARIAARVGSDVPLFLAGGPALIEGRGERVTPLQPPRGPALGVLLVTPALSVRTPDVFAIFAAGGPGAASGSTRLSSDHLASEMRGGLRAADLVARAGVLASSNDLSAATAALVPELVPFRRALLRALRRPVGQSGSGPTLWSLYPSRDEAEAAATELRARLDSGDLPAVGYASPWVHATTIRASQGGDE
jgi:4-diphosphocytidyl-2-C-methyl-D-erythritol kinase